jgi:hypothetical protein
MLCDIDFRAHYARLDLIDGKHLLRRIPTPVHELVAQKLGDAFQEGHESIKRGCNPARVLARYTGRLQMRGSGAGVGWSVGRVLS